MTTGARNAGVRADQGEGRVVVVERGGLPGRGTVADIALLGESAGHVVRIRGAIVVLQMATDAGHAGQVEVPVFVTVGTLQFGVRASQREAGLGMVERSGLPGGGAVAGCAIGRKSAGHVIGVARAVVVLHVARRAGGTCQIEIVGGVAVAARQLSVRAGQREAGGIVVEVGGLPGGNAVAILAGLEKLERDVIRTRRPLEIGHVARIALERQALKLADRGSLVAGVALKRGMRSNQRKAVLVIAHRLLCDLPALYTVAALAGRAHIAVMNIGMAVIASRTGVGKDGLRVALGAAHLFVHAKQRVTGFQVVEFGNCPDRLPSKDGVAVLTCNVQVAVGTARRHRTTGWRLRPCCRGAQ